MGDPVTATDPNSVDNDNLTYMLSGTDAASFTINSESATAGQISVGSGVELDYETKKSYMVTVMATDPERPQRLHRRDHQGHQRGRSPGYRRG